MSLSSEGIAGYGTTGDIEKVGQKFGNLPGSFLHVRWLPSLGPKEDRPESIRNGLDWAPVWLARRIINARSASVKECHTRRDHHMECDQAFNPLKNVTSLIGVELDRSYPRLQLQGVSETVPGETFLYERISAPKAVMEQPK